MIKQITKKANRIILLFALTFSLASSQAQVTTDATAAYGLRKLNPSYAGKAIQLRRSCDDASTDIGFTTCGDLDTNALKAFVYGAPALGALGTSSQASFSLRKLGCSYTGNAIRVRRSCDNAETDIGFTANGDLDTVALKNFVFGAGPLNMITPVANVAYSLRRMRCAYSGFAIRVRRSSDNTTQDIGFTVSGDLDTVALKTFVGAGNGFINIWYDQSGNAKDLSQATPGNQPQIIASGVVLRQNGKPTVRFTASSTQTLRYAGTISSGNGSFSIIAISSRNNTTLAAGSEIFGWGNNASAGNRIGLWNDINTGNNSIELLNRAKIGNSTTAGAMDLKTWIYTSGNISTGLSGFYNGSAISTTLFSGLDITPNVATNQICMGAVPTTTAHPFDGNISEVIGFASSLNTSDRQTLEYLQSLYYGIAGPVAVSITSTTADAYVTTWYDQSGNGRNATQATLSRQPRIMNASVIERQNGKPALRFLNINSGLATGSFTAFSTAACFNGVAKVNTNLTYNAIVSKTGSGSNANIPAPIDFYNARNVVGNGTGYVFKDVTNSFNAAKPLGIWTFRAQNGGSFDAYYNGSANPPSGTAGTTFNDVGNPLYIGMRADGVTGLDGWISEILTFSSFPSDADRQYFEYTQALYYNIAGPVYATPTIPPSGFVTTWYDQSGNGNHVSQATNSRQPVIVQAGKLITLNGRPAMRSSSVLQTNLTGNLASTYTGTGLFANAVYQADTTTTNNLRIMSTGNGSQFDWNQNGLFNINHRGGASPTLIIERNATTPSIAITTGTGGIVSASFSGTQRQIFNNNNGSSTVADTRAFNFNKLRLFQSFNDPTLFEPIESFTGRLSEYILFTKAVGNARRTILENNQATYYGITLANAKFSPVDPTYNRTMNGIGFQSSSDSIQKTRVSQGFIIEDDASSGTNFLRDAGDYIMAGINCNTNAATSTSNLSQNVLLRWNTDWEVKRTDVNNNGGSVKFIFDFGDYWKSTQLPSSAISQYVLLKRSASNGTFDTVNVTSKTLSGDRVIFTLNASNINTFFTLGTMNPTLAPLPIDLTDFRCSKAGIKSVNLTWNTASETNSDYFVVERSADGKNFKAIGKVKAAGNSSAPKEYNYTDNSPFMGTNFYRLKQYDFNGSNSTSNLCAVNVFNSATAGNVKIYPNPASTSLTIETGNSTATKITIVNSLGAVVYTSPVNAEQNIQTVDCSKLISGIYMVQIQTQDAGTISQKVIIQN